MQGQQFAEWKKQVDQACIRVCGLPTDCLPDIDYFALYLAGDTPKEAVEYAFESEWEA